MKAYFEFYDESSTSEMRPNSSLSDVSELRALHDVTTLVVGLDQGNDYPNVKLKRTGTETLPVAR